MQTASQEVRTFFVTSVTWRRRSIFQAEPLARLFLDTLRHCRAQQRYLPHEFVLMPEHFHLLLTPMPAVSLEKALQLIKGGFSFRAKQEMGLNLEIWQPGPTNHRIRGTADYARHVAYIRENPVKRHLVARAEEYPYSSACRVLEVDPAPPGLKAQVRPAALELLPPDCVAG
jgi:putative transposase